MNGLNPGYITVGGSATTPGTQIPLFSNLPVTSPSSGLTFINASNNVRIDAAKGVITHVVEGSLRPSYIGTDQPRPFKLEGDTLIIGDRQEDGSSYFRELHRVK